MKSRYTVTVYQTPDRRPAYLWRYYEMGKLEHGGYISAEHEMQAVTMHSKRAEVSAPRNWTDVCGRLS